MASGNYYEYVNEASVDPELMCIICDAPMKDPWCTSCDHTFCRECITQWIQRKNDTCPSCRHQPLSVDVLTQASRSVRNMLDSLRVKCTVCGQSELRRDNFDNHITKECTKMNVSCPFADIKCPWTGPRDQLPQHLTTCSVVLLRPLFLELTNKNQQLQKQLQQLGEQMNDRLNKKEDLIEKLQLEIRQLKEQLVQHNTEIEHSPRHIAAVKRSMADNNSVGDYSASHRTVMSNKSSSFTTVEANGKFHHDVKSLLNGITSETYNKVQEQLEVLEIDRFERLEAMVNIIYFKAISEPDIGFLLAKLCKQFQKKQVSVSDEKGKIVTHYFRQILLTYCQKEFENDYRQGIECDKRKNEIEAIVDKEKRKKETEKFDDDVVNAKKKKLGNIRFIGELFKLQMLTDTVIYDCIEYLLRDKADEENLECLYRLCYTAGKELDAKANEKSANKARLEEDYRELNNIIVQRQVSSRICRMIQDLIDLRKANWETNGVEMTEMTTSVFSSQATTSVTPHLDPQLVKLFKTATDVEIIAYINENMDPTEEFHIRNVVLSFLEACLIDYGPVKKIQENIAKKGITILNPIIEHKPEAELQAVYAIQNFVSKIEHPPKMAQLLFDIFYDEECVSKDTFFAWLQCSNQSDLEGHAVVKMATIDFFTWLQQAEDEGEEDEGY